MTADHEPHALHVPEHFRVWLYSVRSVDIPGEHQSAFCLLTEEVRRSGPNGFVNLAETWRWSKHRMEGVAAFLTSLTKGVPRGEEAERVVVTAKDLANRVHAYAGTSAVDRLGDLTA